MSQSLGVSPTVYSLGLNLEKDFSSKIKKFLPLLEEATLQNIRHNSELSTSFLSYWNFTGW